VLQESDALSFMPRFMAEGDLRSGRLATLPVPGLKQSVRFGAAWLRGRALGGAGRESSSRCCTRTTPLCARRRAKPQSSP
jgi:DNA-binding transcriptional LysR family regulator